MVILKTKNTDPARKPGSGMRPWIAVPAGRFLSAMPALVLAFFLLRLAVLAHGWPPGGTAHGTLLVIGAFVNDLLALGRYLPVLFLMSWPLLALRTPRARLLAIGGFWSLLVLIQVGLSGYFLITRAMLGADLFQYSWSEIKTSAVGGFRPDILLTAAGAAAIASLWLVLRWRIGYVDRVLPARTTAAVFSFGVAMLLAGPQEFSFSNENEYARDLSRPELAFFVDGNVVKILENWHEETQSSLPATNARTLVMADSEPILGFHYLDPRYPFLHLEQSPDVLGAHMAGDRKSPPNLVFLIIEGLGRSFSGPRADLGSFTPFLDSLAANSLYFENFLSGQGRTFAVLPTIFGSLPYGERGFDALGNAMPEAATLLNILGGQGYRTRFFCGWDPNFDQEKTFLRHQAVDEIYGVADFGRQPPPNGYWGFEDGDLMSFVLSHEERPISRPFVDVIQTITMHTPYWFPGQDRYFLRLEKQLDRLGVLKSDRGRYREQRSIYASILYTDDTLRRYFQEASKQPWFRNTIFLITGDHRLPEIPEGEWIDRYHVPLIIYSPMLKKPERIKAVSSQFDIAPSVLAFLTRNYGLRSPAHVAWIGSGLDLAPDFHNAHEMPIMQTKGTLTTFIHGSWALDRGNLYRLHDGMDAEPEHDETMQGTIRARFQAFRSANREFQRSGTLMPNDGSRHWVSYDASKRAAVVSVAPETGLVLGIDDVRISNATGHHAIAIDIVATNSGWNISAPVVPIAVLIKTDGREQSETYGSPLRVPAHGNVQQHIPIDTHGAAPGRYYLSVILSDPAKGGRVGIGRFHIPVALAR